MPNLDPNDIANAVWYVVHVRDVTEQEATFRVGVINMGGGPDKDPDDVPNAPVRLCLAQGMTPPLGVQLFGPMDESMSHLVYGMFDGEKMPNFDHQKMVEKLNQLDSNDVWMNMRTNPN